MERCLKIKMLTRAVPMNRNIHEEAQSQAEVTRLIDLEEPGEGLTAGLWEMRRPCRCLWDCIRWREDSWKGLEEIASPTGYLTVQCSGLRPLVEMKQKDQEVDIPWASRGQGGFGPSSPEAEGRRITDWRLYHLSLAGPSTLWLDRI